MCDQIKMTAFSERYRDVSLYQTNGLKPAGYLCAIQTVLPSVTALSDAAGARVSRACIRHHQSQK